MNEESTCQAILNQYDPQLESYFDDESTLFRDLVSDTKSMSGFQESTAAAAATFLFTKRDEQQSAVSVTKPSSSIAAPTKLATAPPQQQQQPVPTSIVALHTSTTKTPQRRIKTTIVTPVAPPPVQATAAAAAAPAASRTTKSKPSPNKPPMPQSTEAKKKNALRSALSAFLHLHQPHMTKNEQEAMLKKYESREYEMWAMLAERFGAGSVPSRFLQSGEHAMRGSAKVVLTPKPHPSRETERLMLAQSLDLEVKETVLRTMTVDMLLRELKLRWNAMEEDTQSRNLTLHLYAPGMNDALHGSQMVRDCMVDGCMEYAWTMVDPPPVDLDVSDIQEHSLLGSDWPKRQRRIQPTQVLE